MMDLLTRLDERVLPRLARGLHRVSRVFGRRRPRALPVAAAVLLIAVVVTAIVRPNEPATGGPDPRSPIYVGVTNGDLIADYATTTRAELDRLVGEQPVGRIYALVTLTEYVTPAGAADLLATTDEVEPVAALTRVPLPRRQTELVRLPAARLPGDVVAAMRSVAQRKARDAATFAELANSESGRLREIYTSNADVASAEAAAYQDRCACIYALVVRAPAGVLLRLAGLRGVRVVDPAPEVVDVAGTVFVAPLPEQARRVEPPPDDALPEPAGATGRPS